GAAHAEVVDPYRLALEDALLTGFELVDDVGHRARPHQTEQGETVAGRRERGVRRALELLLRRGGLLLRQAAQAQRQLGSEERDEQRPEDQEEAQSDGSTGHARRSIWQAPVV